MELNIGKKLKELRIKEKMTIQKVANILNVTNQAVSKWENNLSYPSIKLLPKIAKIYNITIDDLFK